MGSDGHFTSSAFLFGWGRGENIRVHRYSEHMNVFQEAGQIFFYTESIIIT